MGTYDIIAWNSKEIVTKDKLFSGQYRIEPFKGLTYEEAKKELLRLYNSYYGKERGKVKTLYEAYDRDCGEEEGMYVNLKAFDYRGRVFEIIETGGPSCRWFFEP